MTSSATCVSVSSPHVQTAASVTVIIRASFFLTNVDASFAAGVRFEGFVLSSSVYEIFSETVAATRFNGIK
jgi:hypothetical protein